MSLTAADLVALQQSILNGVAASEANIKAYIDTSVGAVNKRVDAVEATVLSVQQDVERIKAGQLKGENNLTSVILDTIPSLLAAERAALAKVLVIKGANADLTVLDKFVSDLLCSLAVENVEVVAVTFMGKPRSDKSRLIRLEVKSAVQAAAILKSKSKLQSIPAWKNVYITQMRSKMAGKFEGRMNHFYRVNKETIPMKKHQDCLQFTETGIRVPLHKFAADTIQVGPVSYSIGENFVAQNHQGRQVSESPGPSIPYQPDRSHLKRAAAIKNGSAINNKKSNQSKLKVKPLKGGGSKATKRTRDTPYTMPNDQADDNGEYDDIETEVPEVSVSPQTQHHQKSQTSENMDAAIS
jgi:hypothetical protein